MVDAGTSSSKRSRDKKTPTFPDADFVVSPTGSYQDLKTLHAKNCKKYFCRCKKHVVSVICVNETRKLYWVTSRSVEEKVAQGREEGYYNRLLRIVKGALRNRVKTYIEGLGGLGSLSSLTSPSPPPPSEDERRHRHRHRHHHKKKRKKKSPDKKRTTTVRGAFATGGGESPCRKPKMTMKYNGSAKGNLKLLKEGCYCHYHPHLAADVCNADFLRRVVSRDNQTGPDENDDLDALTPRWMVHLKLAICLMCLFSLSVSLCVCVLAQPRLGLLTPTFFFMCVLSSGCD